MIEALIPSDTDRVNLFGMWTVKKIYVPFILMGLSQLLVLNVAFEGHLCGILAALLLYKTPLKHLLIPKRWIYNFEKKQCVTRLENKATYYRV